MLYCSSYYKQNFFYTRGIYVTFWLNSFVLKGGIFFFFCWIARIYCTSQQNLQISIGKGYVLEENTYMYFKMVKILCETSHIFIHLSQLTVYGYKDGPCYRCLYPKPPPPETVTNCSDGGVLGVSKFNLSDISTFVSVFESWFPRLIPLCNQM